MSGFRAFGRGHGSYYIETADDLSRKPLGGIVSRMPDNSAKIFYESMLGRKVSSFTSYKSCDEALYALCTGEAAAIAVCDVTADYLLSVNDDLRTLDTTDMAAIENMDAPRFSFGLAAANNAEGRELTEQINKALTILSSGGALERINELFADSETAYYSQGSLYRESLYAEAMEEVDLMVSRYREHYGTGGGKTLCIGVTGSTPPIDMFDSAGKPEGYSVALSKLIGAVLGREVKLVVSEGETIFTGLMSGKIDLVFAYGAGNITTEGSKGWVMTDGYLPMQKYEFVVLEVPE